MRDEVTFGSAATMKVGKVKAEFTDETLQHIADSPEVQEMVRRLVQEMVGEREK